MEVKLTSCLDGEESEVDDYKEQSADMYAAISAMPVSRTVVFHCNKLSMG